METITTTSGLSRTADRVLRMIDVSGFMSTTQARSYNQAVSELLDLSFIKMQSKNAMDCYILSAFGKKHIESVQPDFCD